MSYSTPTHASPSTSCEIFVRFFAASLITRANTLSRSTGVPTVCSNQDRKNIEADSFQMFSILNGCNQEGRVCDHEVNCNINGLPAGAIVIIVLVILMLFYCGYRFMRDYLKLHWRSEYLMAINSNRDPYFSSDFDTAQVLPLWKHRTLCQAQWNSHGFSYSPQNRAGWRQHLVGKWICGCTIVSEQRRRVH